MAHVFFGQQSFLKRLIEVQVAAGEAAKRADKSLLKRKKGQADPALYDLVGWRWECIESADLRLATHSGGHRRVNPPRPISHYPPAAPAPPLLYFVYICSMPIISQANTAIIRLKREEARK
jgi:hypothetical protein